MTLEDLGQLQELIPPNSTGGYDLENITIQSIPTEQLNSWYCPAMVTTTTRLNSTTVATQTKLNVGNKAAERA